MKRVEANRDKAPRLHEVHSVEFEALYEKYEKEGRARKRSLHRNSGIASLKVQVLSFMKIPKLHIVTTPSESEPTLRPTSIFSSSFSSIASSAVTTYVSFSSPAFSASSRIPSVNGYQTDFSLSPRDISSTFSSPFVLVSDRSLLIIMLVWTFHCHSCHQGLRYLLMTTIFF